MFSGLASALLNAREGDIESNFTSATKNLVIEQEAVVPVFTNTILATILRKDFLYYHLQS